MREIRLSGLEGGGAKPIVSPYPYLISGRIPSTQVLGYCRSPLTGLEPRTREPEDTIMLRTRCPGGTPENSPAIHRWERD